MITPFIEVSTLRYCIHALYDRNQAKTLTNPMAVFSYWVSLRSGDRGIIVLKSHLSAQYRAETFDNGQRISLRSGDQGIIFPKL
jgi:hypothetical protein